MPLYVHSLTYTPPARFDEQSWNRVRVEQSPDDSTFTAIETISLTSGDVDPSTLDSDPSEPATREITTDQATLAQAYFRVVWLDSDDAESPPSGSVFSPGGSGVGLPTLDELKEQVKVTRADNDDLLQRILNAAIALARIKTGRQLDKLPSSGSGDHTIERRVAGGVRFIRIPDAREITTVTLDEDDPLEESDLAYHSQDGVIVAIGLPAHCATTCEVVGKFGFDPLPDDLFQAIVEEAASRYYDRTTGNADSAASEEYGGGSFSRPPGFARMVFRNYRVLTVG
jgi:hypothetical protein